VGQNPLAVLPYIWIPAFAGMTGAQGTLAAMTEAHNETKFVIPAEAGIQKHAGIWDMTESTAYVYVMASRRNGTLYIGVTSNLVERVYEHKHDLVESFTRKYQVHQLVYFEEHSDIHQAIQREKQMKKWKRQWKIVLIEKSNPRWRDLYDDLLV
jgi:putative endonuclease